MEEPRIEDGGEIEAALSDIRKESRNMMDDLMEVDMVICSLIGRLQSGDIEKDEIIEALESIRIRIGVLEEEDKRELGEEEVAANLITKLKKWVDMVI